MFRSVRVNQHGRDGEVIYTENRRSIDGYREFGGGDVVAIVSMGSIDDWRAHHAWALERRGEILRYVADELIRRHAPSCVADIDAASGVILLRQRTAAAPAAGESTAPTRTTSSPQSSSPTSGDAAWVRRYGELKGRLGAIGLIVVLVFGALLWFKTRVLVVQPGKGTPLGSTVRTATHLVTLIDQLQPYTPSLHHDPSTERYTLSVLLVPLDGGAPQLVQLERDLQPGSYRLARVIGSDGRTLWIAANALYGVDLASGARVTAAQVQRASPDLDPRVVADTRRMDIVDGRLQLLNDDHSAAWALDPATRRATPVTPRNVARPLSDPPLTLYQAAGLRTSSAAWLGLQSQADLDGEYRPGRWLRAVESATDTPRELRRLVRGQLGDLDSSGELRRIVAMAPVAATEYRNASFLRRDERSEPVRVADPDSVLMLHTSGDGTGTGSTLLVSRVELASGALRWTRDTGLHRFALAQILPGETTTVFVGTRPPVPDQLSEPLLVILDHASGQATTHSLWR